MTEAELQELISDSPILYHMAERGSWESICGRGLLSTSALLDLYGVSGDQREAIESARRPTKVLIASKGKSTAVIRDQIPLNEKKLRRCLPEHLAPSDWYRLLNTKVFFWLTRERLQRLTNAKAYSNRSHDVIEVDTQSLIKAHRDRIWLCQINSGNTSHVPAPRDETTFKRIGDYPYDRRRRRSDRVVELAMDHSVPDIVEHVSRVVVMRGTAVERELFRRAD